MKNRIKQLRVFSTYVEVILISTALTTDMCSFLHVCGGDPVDGNICLIDLKFSPRMWR